MKPTDKDLKNLQLKIEKHLSKLDENGKAKEVTENNLKAFIRSAIREQWMRADVKLAFLLSSREPDYRDNTRTKWIHTCNKCKNKFKEGDVEVDHTKGEKSFTDLSEALQWANSILHVSGEDLQILCKECHTIKSYCESSGLDWKDDTDWAKATIEKEVIAICKGSGCPEKKWLEGKGIEPASNKDKRRNQVRSTLISMRENDE